MEMSTREHEGVTVVELAGRLSSTTVSSVADELTKIAQVEGNKVIINLENLEFVSSAGLRIILRTAKLLDGKSGALKISNANGVVREVLEKSGFHSLLHIYDREEDALKAFSAM